LQESGNLGTFPVPTRQRGDGDIDIHNLQEIQASRSDPTTRGRRIVLLLLQIPRPEGGSDPTLRGRRLERDGTDLPFLQSSDPTTRGRRHDRNLRTLLDTPVPTRQRGDGDGEKDRCKKRLARFRPDNEGTATIPFQRRRLLKPSFRPDNEGTATFQLPFSAQIAWESNSGAMGRCEGVGVQAKGLLRLMLPLYPCTLTRLHAYTLRR